MEPFNVEMPARAASSAVTVVARGGYYHDGRLRLVVEHQPCVELRASETEIVDLVEYLKSI